MKNLKRALSLVLSTAMLLGMMVVGTGAAHTDVKAEHNTEAIALVTAAGIMGAGETFNPDGELTRGEMAVIMTRMMNLDTKDYKGTTNFVDAGWAADYIDACYANGYMAGVSATEFGTAQKVTTAQAALMMLKALGYFEFRTINDWMLDTIKLASEIDLLDGIDAKANAVLTRNEVAQLAFNALNTVWVREAASGNTTSIKGENLEINIGAVVTDNRDTATEKLLNKLFDDRFEQVDAKDAFDAFGLPAVQWVDNEKDADEKVIVSVTKEADEVVIAEENYAKGKTEAYKDLVDEDFDETATLEKAANAGDMIYFYADKDEDGKKTGNYTGYVVNYALAQVEEIDEDVTVKDEKDGIKAYISLDICKDPIDDVDFADFDYEEDDYIFVVLNDDGTKVLASELVESVEGKVTAENKKGQFKIDGDYYAAAEGVEIDIDDEAVWYLNKAGQIIFSGEVTKEVSEDYAVIYNVVDITEDAEKNEDGYTGKNETVYSVYVILADGSKAKYVLDEDSNDLVSEGECFMVVAYSVDKDDELVIEADDVAELASANFEENKYVEVGATNKKVYADSKTEFIFAEKQSDDDSSKMVVNTATGIKNVDYVGEIFVIYEKTAIQYVFVNGIEEIETDAEYAILSDNAYDSEKVDGKTVYTFETEDGKIETKDAGVRDALAALSQGSIFTYVLTDGYVAEVADITVLVENVVEYNYSEVEYVGEDFYVIAGEEYTVADDAEIVKISIVMDGAEIDTLKVTDGELAKGDKVVIFEADKKEIEVAYIVKVRV